MDSDQADGGIFNVGSGRAASVRRIAAILLELHEAAGTLEPEISRQFRTGDIRHCYADISALRQLGFAPAVGLEDGLAELVAWADTAESEDHFDTARRELESKGLA